MIDVDDRCQALSARGWRVSIEFRAMAHTQAGKLVGTWVAIAEKEDSRLSGQDTAPTAALEGLFWKIAKIEPGIEAELETL